MIDPTKILPTGDNVLIRVVDPSKSPGGIILPDAAKKGGRIRFAKVLACGPSVHSVKLTGQDDNLVLVDLDKAARIPDSEELLFVLKDDEILGVVP